jgi:hypothetical protein
LNKVKKFPEPVRGLNIENADGKITAAPAAPNDIGMAPQFAKRQPATGAPKGWAVLLVALLRLALQAMKTPLAQKGFTLAKPPDAHAFTSQKILKLISIS